MKKLIFASVATILIISIVGMALAAAAAAPKSFDAKQAAGVKATDAVSGKEFTIAENGPYSEYQAKFYYFENEANKKLFDADPVKYAK